MPPIRTISESCGRPSVSGCCQSRSMEPWWTTSPLTQTWSRLYNRKAAETSSEMEKETDMRFQMNLNKMIIRHRLVLAHISSVLSFREGTYLDSNLPGRGRFLPRSTLCDYHVIFPMSCFSQARQRRITELLSPGCGFCPARVGAGHPTGSHCSGPLRWPGREDSRYPADASCPYVKMFADPVFCYSVSWINWNVSLIFLMFL